ncbi:hypothetical protein AcW1_001477 [Taiwanofungus camphoratus]|nr:hypothetical protein AcV7_003675 [Antrodia cinnamomea]KAI0945199.1 hypothetical protein AcW1_001477 [Antrodia cinnamomea]
MWLFEQSPHFALNEYRKWGNDTRPPIFTRDTPSAHSPTFSSRRRLPSPHLVPSSPLNSIVLFPHDALFLVVMDISVHRSLPLGAPRDYRTIDTRTSRYLADTMLSFRLDATLSTDVYLQIFWLSMLTH